MPQRESLRQILRDLQRALQAAGLWDTPAPSAQQMASTMPFMCDTMPAATWLRWIMWPRFGAILDANAPLPNRCDVRDYVEYEWQDYLKTAPEKEKLLRRDILDILGKMDDCINKEPSLD